MSGHIEWQLPDRNRQKQQGFLGLIVGVGLFALAGTAGFLSIVINSAENRQTLRVLTDGTDAQREALTDQQIRNLQNDLNDNLNLATGFASLGTTVLPGAQVESNAAMAANALLEQAPNAIAATTGYLSDPNSSWNSDSGAARPAEGIVPTSGILPEDIAGGSGEVRFSLVWNATVDLDLHVIDSCGFEISFRRSLQTCDDFTGELDVDNTRGGNGATENIVWTDGAPRGTFQYWVECYSGCSGQPAS